MGAGHVPTQKHLLPLFLRFGFRVSGSGHRAGVRFRVQDFGFQDSGGRFSGFRVQGVGFRVSGFGRRV